MQINILENLYNTVKKYPNKIAVIDESSEITYADLWDAASHIGDSLSGYHIGIQQKSIVIFIDKSIDCLKAMLGTLYSGNYYVVMDIQTPIDRFREIINTLENKILITTPELANTVENLQYEGQVCLINELELNDNCISAKFGDNEKFGAPWERRIDTDLVYVLFTSGSTGIPKGVAVSHRSLIDYVDAFLSAIKIDETDIWGNQSPFCFDISLKDIYVTQKTGGTLCIIPSKYFATPKKLLNYLEDKQVTIITWVPTAYGIIAKFQGLQKIHPNQLQKFIFSGETMPASVYNYWKGEYPDATFIQLYGPTEITGACSVYEVTREFSEGESIPIGNAFQNTELFLLDDNDQIILPSNTNEIGEIIVRGSCLAAGYFNNWDKTEDVFVQNPLNKKYPEKVYRTGDLAYWNELQELVFVSRKDLQIKHSGHRIELGEVEAGIYAIDGIDSCCCVQNRSNDEIVCFYVGESLDKKDIMAIAKERLPKYMMPTIYYKVDELPTLSNGKLDRKSLDIKVNSASEEE